MATRNLYDTYGDENRQVEQGNTWDYEVAPIGSYQVKNSAQQVITYYQWRCNVSLSKSYRYVGLTETAAIDAAAEIREAYNTITQSKYTSRFDRTSGRWIFTEIPNIEQGNVQVTPTHVSGAMWEVSVTVAGTAQLCCDRLSAAAPTLTELQALLANLANYPELEEAN